MQRLLGTLTTILLSAGAVHAAPLDTAPRPVPRQAEAVASIVAAPRATATGRDAVPTLRPRARPTPARETRPTMTLSTKTPEFGRWIGAFRGRALAQGISSRVFDTAFVGVTYDPAIIERDRNQSEFTKTIWEYLDSAVSDARVVNGRAALEQQRATLQRIEAKYGVEKEVVTAIWGMESAYGSHKGDTDIVGALSTLAFDARRGKFFEAQLVAALKILENGDVAPRGMTGSWAGAMGHTQFIPTSYLAYAVDFTGDGKRDIWGEDPTDALASTAAYLANFGWKKGMPWGVEVVLPTGFDWSGANRRNTKLPSEWAQLGVKAANGKPIPDHGPTSVLLPAGAKGAAFLIFKNFEAIERYNTADAYVIAVGHLSDRIAGGAALRTPWPRGDRALTFAERQEMQRLLTAQGFDTKGVDGMIGPRTLAALREFQKARGQPADGYASLAILERLR